MPPLSENEEPRECLGLDSAAAMIAAAATPALPCFVFFVRDDPMGQTAPTGAELRGLPNLGKCSSAIAEATALAAVA